MTSNGIPLTHRSEKHEVSYFQTRVEIMRTNIYLYEFPQFCNIVLLPVKSLRESVQLIPSQFEYSGPMDLTQVISHRYDNNVKSL